MANKKPDCVKCGWVPATDGNGEFITLLDKYHVLMSGGDSTIQADTIKLICDIELKRSWIKFWIKPVMSIDDFLYKVNIYYLYGFNARYNGSQRTTTAQQEVKTFLDGPNQSKQR